MPQTRASYHHGGLRDALLAACVALIEAEGIGAVSLRRVARDAGVSPGAPYHHFPDRSALFAAIAVQGHQLLLERLRAAREAAPTAVRGLGAILEAYVAFAREHPGHLHLMLRSELSASPQVPEAAHAGEAAIQLLTETVQDCQREGSAPAGDPEPLVAAVWALAIGIVTLWLDGPLEGRCVQLGTTPEALTARITALLESLLAGRAA
ncbi:TetR/AcrR family transcriptional regulator [Dactylosporangium sp. NPDC050588]|uniref:TetR/AcrR family transcriptional regulator n=1 Tax=Dactylosporangium sp. NPDC050588 TaxID=3157211 RepID=UPI0033E9971D